MADPSVQWKQSFDGPAGTDLAADYHVYQVYREPGLIKIAIDGVVRGQYSKVRTAGRSVGVRRSDESGFERRGGRGMARSGRSRHAISRSDAGGLDSVLAITS